MGCHASARESCTQIRKVERLIQAGPGGQTQFSVKMSKRRLSTKFDASKAMGVLAPKSTTSRMRYEALAPLSAEFGATVTGLQHWRITSKHGRAGDIKRQ